MEDASNLLAGVWETIDAQLSAHCPHKQVVIHHLKNVDVSLRLILSGYL